MSIVGMKSVDSKTPTHFPEFPIITSGCTGLMRKFKWVLECFQCTYFEVCELSVADEIFRESCYVPRDDLYVHVPG